MPSAALVVLLALALAFGLVLAIAARPADAVPVGDCSQLESQISAATGLLTATVIELGTDIACSSELVIGTGKYIRIQSNVPQLRRRIQAVGGDHRVLRVASGSKLILQDVTLEDGVAFLATDVNEFSSLTVLQDTSNRASSGGCLYNAGTIVLIKNVLFSNCQARGGGALFNAGTITAIQDSTFDSNKAWYVQDAGASDIAFIIRQGVEMLHPSQRGRAFGAGDPSDPFLGGGAIAQVDATAQIESIAYCTFTSNSADDRGGAIYVGAGPITSIQGCIFEDNSAVRSTKSVAYGGAIAVVRQVPAAAHAGTKIGSIVDTRFTRNVATAEIRDEVYHQNLDNYQKPTALPAWRRPLHWRLQ